MIKTGVSELRVSKAPPDDVGRSIVRLDPVEMDGLEVEAGDALSLRGDRTTVAKVLPASPGERNPDQIQMDGLIRNNAKVGLGDKVTVKPTQLVEADRLELRPVSQMGKIPSSDQTEFWQKIMGGLVMVEGDVVRASLVGKRGQDFRVEEVKPDGAVIVTPETEVIITSKEESDGGSRHVSYEDVGGLDEELRRVRELIETPLKQPQIFDRLGIDPPKGILLQGPPGCGKTLIARAVAHESDAHFESLAGPEIMQKYYGQSEARLREVFERSNKRAPAIVFIDEIEAIAAKRNDLGSEKQVERRVISQLLALLDGLEPRQQVIVIGATNVPDTLDEAIRRPGRFDREIEVGVPDGEDRAEILRIHTRGMPLSEGVDLGELARRTQGYVGADLASLARESAMQALRRTTASEEIQQGSLPYDLVSALQITAEDFAEAMKGIEPSALREWFVEIPRTGWDKVGGLEEAKSKLQHALEATLSETEAYNTLDLSPPGGVLLYGPPGTGKTLLARAVASEYEVNFIPVQGSELLSRYFGESETAVGEVFRRARRASPCVLFFDEMDALVPSRGQSTQSETTERITSQFLVELDGIEPLSDVIVLGATNRRDRLDPAILRPGRFDMQIECPLPGEEARNEIFHIHTENKPLAEDVQLSELARQTEGLSGADIRSVCQQAARKTLHDKSARSKKVDGQEFSVRIPAQHFQQAINQLPFLLREEKEAKET